MTTTRSKRSSRVLSLAVLIGLGALVLAGVSGIGPKGISAPGMRLQFDTAQRPGGSVIGFAGPSAGTKVAVQGDGPSAKTGIDAAATGCPGQQVVAFQGETGGNGGPLDVTVGGGGSATATGVRAVARAGTCE
jgi:hypothetical protein